MVFRISGISVGGTTMRSHFNMIPFHGMFAEQGALQVRPNQGSVIRHIRKYLSRSSTETLIHAFILSRLDYCNSLFYGLPKYQLSKLQRVMNASARLVYCAPKSCHITPLLRELHWLPVCYHIEYKIILLTFKVLHGMAPDYLRQLISVLPPSRYNLRRNDDYAALLTFPKIRTKKTLADRSFSCAAPRL